ncbi:TonB-dependent receptor, partial [Pseudomonas sp.]|uniref:TonB-dependent receptor n=1 Tax=Pseudomonas sp. TaxID=306 RepID=UPI0026282EF1
MTIKFTCALLAGTSILAPGAAQSAAINSSDNSAVAAGEAKGAPANRSGNSDSPTPSDSSGQVSEIIVTAQRRAQSIVSVPVSITASTGLTLKAEGIKSVTDLTLKTPGVTSYFGLAHTQVFIRGIGNTVFNGADPSVATFIDDVPRPYGMTHGTLVNVERVEILKGAQGGLYGRNATAGVINIITRQPSDTASAEGQVSYGSLKTFDGQGYLNVPLTEKIDWNVSAERISHDFYSKNLAKPYYSPANFPTSLNPGITPQQQLAAANLLNSGFNPPRGASNQDFWDVDSKLLFKPAANVKVTIDGDYLREHSSDGTAERNFSSQNDISLLNNSLLPFLAGPAIGYRGLKAVFPDNLQAPTGKWSGYYTEPARIYQTEYGASGKVELNLKGVDLTSITAWRHFYDTFDSEIPAVEVPTIRADTTFQKHFFYQELRLVSNEKGPLQFLGGATLFTDNTGINSRSYTLDLFQSPITTSVTKRTSWSVYGQVGYDILARLNLSISGRYVWERSSISFFTPLVSQASTVGKKFLPAATLSYKTDGGVIYARYAKGFKTGGILPTLSPSLFPGGLGSTFKPEQVDTYEVGYRTELLDRKLQFTSAVYYNNYRDIQYTDSGNIQNSQLSSAVINAGSARTYGAESSLTWRVARPLSVSVNGAYLNAKYKQFSLTNSPLFVSFNLDGKTMIQAPKWQASVNVDLDQPITSELRLVGDVIWAYNSSRNIADDTAGIGPLTQNGYSLTNLRLGVRTTDDRYGFALTVNNLFDKFYITAGAVAPTLGKYGVMGSPRIISGELSV